MILVLGSSAFNCPSDLHAFPLDSCVSLSPGGRSNCDPVTDGLAVLSDSQLSPGGILSVYAAAVLESNQLMWLGYAYNSGGQLLQDGQGSSQTVSGSVLNDNSNFDLSVSESVGEGVCVAVNRNGTFVRRQCNEALQWSLCEKEFMGKYFFGQVTYNFSQI